ncbi:MAG TPA: hypothetical protein VFE33_27940 [Thermoanaerobaculia bacterium]|nr:hypothetical protein [Thermoanaerobaculia bacterium]
MTDPADPTGPPAEPPPFSWGALLFVVISFLVGIGYLLWVTAIEGRRVWIVFGLIVLIAGFAALAHWLMGRTRR